VTTDTRKYTNVKVTVEDEALEATVAIDEERIETTKRASAAVVAAVDGVDSYLNEWGKPRFTREISSVDVAKGATDDAEVPPSDG
jgi:hypothetical protein